MVLLRIFLLDSPDWLHHALNPYLEAKVHNCWCVRYKDVVFRAWQIVNPGRIQGMICWNISNLCPCLCLGINSCHYTLASNLE